MESPSFGCVKRAVWVVKMVYAPQKCQHFSNCIELFKICYYTVYI